MGCMGKTTPQSGVFYFCIPLGHSSFLTNKALANKLHFLDIHDWSKCHGQPLAEEEVGDSSSKTLHTFSPPHVGTPERQPGEGERHLGNPSMLLY